MADPAQQRPLARNGVPPYETTYSRDTLAASWPRGHTIDFSVAGWTQRSFRIPIAFVAGGGDNTWAFVHYLLSLMVNEEGRIVVLPERTPVDLAAVPWACAIDFEAFDGQTDLTWRRGPTGHRSYKAIVDGEPLNESSRISGVSEFSGNQARFASDVKARDRTCLFTRSRVALQAAHIVPPDREDVYVALSPQSQRDLYPYDTCAGLYLNAGPHGTFDLWQWSVYYKDGNYHVHSFSGLPGDDQMSYHGRTFSSARMHPETEEWELPNRYLCEWHYTQCVLMRIRGFSSGLAVNAQ